MKFELFVNQKAIIDHGFDLDLVDGAIMDFCLTFAASGKSETIREAGLVYYWFQHENICDQLPILRMMPDTMYRRMKRLCEKDFLQAHPENKRRGQSYYALLANAFLIESTIGRKSDGASEKNPMVPDQANSQLPPSENFPMASDQNPKDEQQTGEPSDENPMGIGSKSEGPSDENPIYYINNGLGNNRLNTSSSSAKNAGATAEVSDQNLDAEGPPPNPPVAPAPLSPKKVFGDGVLQKQARQFLKDHPDLYPAEMYLEFLRHWTEIVQNSENPADIGKELWRTWRTWNIEKKLANWHPGYLRDQQKANEPIKNTQYVNGSSGRTTDPGAGIGNRTTGQGTGNGKPAKRAARVKPGMFNRDSQNRRDADRDGGGRTIRIDVDPDHQTSGN